MQQLCSFVHMHRGSIRSSEEEQGETMMRTTQPLLSRKQAEGRRAIQGQNWWRVVSVHEQGKKRGQLLARHNWKNATLQPGSAKDSLCGLGQLPIPLLAYFQACKMRRLAIGNQYSFPALTFHSSLISRIPAMQVMNRWRTEQQAGRGVQTISKILITMITVTLKIPTVPFRATSVVRVTGPFLAL